MHLGYVFCLHYAYMLEKRTLWIAERLRVRTMAFSSRLNRLLQEVKNLISAQRQMEPTASPPKHSEKKEEKSLRCPHYFKYLAGRSRKSRIPQGCLTCQKVVECMRKENQKTLKAEES